MDSLSTLGWNDALQRSWADIALQQPKLVPGRVIADYGSGYRVALPNEVSAEPSGRLQYLSQPHELPKIGDWVAVQVVDTGHGIIHTVLPRKSEIGRKQPGSQIQKQILAANVDIAFLVQGLDHDFSPERIQRYLFQLRSEGVETILVLNKADKGKDIEDKTEQLKLFNMPIIVTSAALKEGTDKIAEAITPGKTAVFLGSSGVGKSTITNVLLGQDRQATQSTREHDSKGRHTTIHRELFVLPSGGLIIDTPGLRELQLWGTKNDLSSAFSDIEQFSRECKFKNCTHTGEPGCAVLVAIQSGALSQARLESYFKFQKEIQYLDTKVDVDAAYQRKQNHKKAQRHFNQILRDE